MAHTVGIINGKQPLGGVGGVSDADLSGVVINLLNAGVTTATAYQVTQQTTPDMTVKVNAGRAYVFKSDASNAYETRLDTVANATIASNASGNPRKDAVVIKVDLSAAPNNYASNLASLVVVQGTPAASPVAPTDSAIQSAVGAGNPFYRLANVTVANGAVSVTSADIEDTRTGVQLKIVGGYLRYNLSTNKLQSSNDGTTYTDVGAGVKVQLAYAANTDLHNATALAATTWTDIISNQSFVVDSPASTIEIAVAGDMYIGNGGGVGSSSVRVVIDSAGTPITRTIAGNRYPTGEYSNAFAGSSPITLTGLSAGPHTIKLQMYATNATTVFLLPGTQNPPYFLNITVKEIK